MACPSCAAFNRQLNALRKSRISSYSSAARNRVSASWLLPGAPPFRDSVIGLDISPEEYHTTDRSAATGFCAPLNLGVPRPSRSLRRVGGVGGMTGGLGYRCYKGGGESAARCRLGGVGWTKPEKQGKSPPFRTTREEWRARKINCLCEAVSKILSS
jgi:hypothetical protein